MPTTDHAPAARVRGVLALPRALVRQLAVAVYAWLAFALAFYLIGPRRGVWLIEPALIFAAGAILGRAVEGPWWTSSLGGVFVAVFDVAVTALLRGARGTKLARETAIPAAVLILAGALGGWAGRRRRRAAQSRGRAEG